MIRKLVAWVLVLAAVLLCGCTNIRQENIVPTTEATEPSTFPPPEKTELTAADFVIGENGYMTCTARRSRAGVDVSAYQGDIDWQAVKASGITFAMIRIGGRGYGQAGSLYPDKKAQENYIGAKEAGLDVGVYFFSQAISVAEAVEEAEYVLEQTKDWELTMPVVYDWEYISEEARTAQVEPQMLTDCMNAFCKRIRQEGLETMIYFNTEQSFDMFYMEEVVNTGLWLALYTEYMFYPYKVDMWQYTNQGTVPGIEGNVDINIQLLYDEVA